MLDAEGQVFFVLFRERGHAEHAAGQIDALMLAKHAAIDDFAFHVVAADGQHAQLDQPVAQQDPGAGFYVLRQRLERGGEQIRRACDVTRRDHQLGAGLQRHRRAVFQAPGADLGALQVLEDADGAILFTRHPAQQLDSFGMFSVSAVGKVQPGHVHAGAQQVAQHYFGAAGRADGADDLGPASHGIGRMRSALCAAAIFHRLNADGGLQGFAH